MSEVEKELKLNRKQRMFCEEYMIDLNGTKAAIRAGYSEDTACAIASENLRKPHIRTHIQKLMDERSKNTLVDATFVVNNLVEVYQRCMQKVPVMKFDPVEKSMVQATEADEEGNEQGLWEFDSQGANKSLELLGKHVAMFTEKTESKIDAKHLLTGKVAVNVISTGVPLANRETDINLE